MLGQVISPLWDFVRVGSGGLEADGSDELVEIVDDALIEAVELGSTLAVELGVAC